MVSRSHFGCDLRGGFSSASYRDPTTNGTLYLMNRKGWTLDEGSSVNEHHKVLSGCDYAVLNDTVLVHHQDYKNYFSRPLAHYEGLTIYSLNATR